MNPNSKRIRASWLFIIMVVLVACSVPTLLEELSAVSVENGRFEGNGDDALEDTTSPVPMPVQWGCIWLDEKGLVTGITFLTLQGEYWERRDGTIALLTHPIPARQPADQQPLTRRYTKYYSGDE